jgi:lactoylglutathione lyase
MSGKSSSGGSVRFVHTNIRVRDIDASLRFYQALGFERRGRLQFESAYNLYLGLPGDGDTLELTVNESRTEPYDLGDAYGHIAISVENLDGLLERLAADGIEPEKPPYPPGGRTEYRICFVQDPDGYRIELIDGDFATPQDPDR